MDENITNTSNPTEIADMKLNTLIREKSKYIKGLIIDEGVTTIKENAFKGCTNLNKIVVPSTTKNIEDSAFNGLSETSIILDIKNKDFEVDKDILYTKGKNKIIHYFGKDKSVEIPSSVKEISPNAFKNNKTINTLEIYESINKIGKDAFLNTSALESIELYGKSIDLTSWKRLIAEANLPKNIILDLLKSKPIDISLKYNELEQELPNLSKNAIYNLFIDTTGVDANEFVGATSPELKNSPLSLKLSTAPAGVMFNLALSIPDDVTSLEACFMPKVNADGSLEESNLLTVTILNDDNNVQNANSLFSGCNNLRNINTSSLPKVSNAKEMLKNCIKLANITWGDLFRPSVNENMFLGVELAKTIRAKTESREWINPNAESMGLSNYIYGEKIESLSLNYAQLDTGLSSLEPYYTYTLTVDCSNVDNVTLKNFGQKLKAAPAKVYFDLIPINVGADIVDASGMFQDCSNLISIDMSGFNNVTNADNMFSGCNNLISIDASGLNKVISSSHMFTGCSNLINIDASGFRGTSNTSYMFKDCKSLVSIDTKAFTKVANADYMFDGCRSLTSINTVAFTNVEDAQYMFSKCVNLTDIVWKNLLPSNFTGMFANCPRYKTIEVDWYTRNYLTPDKILSMELKDYKLLGGEGDKPVIPEVIHYNDLTETMMLYEPRQEPYDLTIDCSGVIASEFIGVSEASPFGQKLSYAQNGVFLNLTISNLEDYVTDASYLFYGCDNLVGINLSVFKNIENAKFMFYGCSKLTDIDTFGLTGINNAESMFSNCSGITNITWHELFRPSNTTSMFSGASGAKTITSSANTRSWILSKAENMNITNYTIIIDFCTYSELSASMSTFAAGTYDLTVDCTGSNNDTLKSFGATLNTATEGVYFNLNPIKIGSDITDASNMFSDCSKLASIDTTAFNDIRNANGMFANCSNLTSINWINLIPKTFEGMFTGCPQNKNISVDWYTRKIITDNKTLMALENYTLTGNEEKPVISESIHYKDLAKTMLLYEPNTEPYSLIVDCTDVASKEFYDANPDTISNFGYKLSFAVEGVSFNLKPINLGLDVTNTSNMFFGCNNLISIDTEAFTSINTSKSMFQNCSKLEAISWGSLFKPTTTDNMFTGADLNKVVDTVPNMRSWIEHNAANMSLTNYIINVNVNAKYNELDTLVPTLIAGNYNLTVDCTDVNNDTLVGFKNKLKLSNNGVYFNLNPANVGSDITNASSMFSDCSNLKSLNTSAFTNVTNADSMLSNCSSLMNIDTSVFSNVNSAENMFSGCSNLTEISGTESLANVINAGSMFKGCNKLASIDTSYFTGVTNANQMFYDCSSLTSMDTTAFTRVTSADSMFHNCSKLTSIIWKNLLPSYYTNMFTGCSSAKNIEIDWFTKTYLTDDRISSMGLTNYTLIGGETKPETPVVENIKYADLTKQYILLYEPRTEPYNLTVDCTGVSANEFVGKPSALSLFGAKLKISTNGVLFNLIPVNVGSDVTDTSYMFLGCSSLKNMDTSAFTNVTNANGMFKDCRNLINIDVSPFTNITNASDIFFNCNGLLEVSGTSVFMNIEDASNMFSGCSSLTNIDTSGFINVTNASNMFYNCSNLTSIDTNGFTKVSDANAMFHNCSNLTSITWGEYFRPSINIESTFYGADADKVILASADSITWISINAANISLVNYTFKQEDLTLDYIQLDTELSKLEPYSLYNLTVDCKSVDNKTLAIFGDKLKSAPSSVSFNLIPINVENNITNAKSMFADCSNLLGINTNTFKSLTEASNMFSGCRNLANINWGSSLTPTNFTGMLSGATAAKMIIASVATDAWIKKNATEMNLENYTVNQYKYSDLSEEIPNFVAGVYDLTVDCNDVDNNTLNNLGNILSTANDEVYFNLKPKNVGSDITDISTMFNGCSNLLRIDTSVFNNVTKANNAFQYCSNLLNIDISNFASVEDTSFMFYYCEKLNNIIGVELLNTVTNASGMFEGCKKLTNINTSGFTNVTDASYMFSGCNGITDIETEAFANVIDSSYMFRDCVNLKTVDTSVFTAVTDSSNMFSKCNGLTSIDTSGFKSTLNASYMFYGCKNLTDVTGDGSFVKTENANYMFSECEKLTNINTNGFIKAVDTSYMFSCCSSLTSIDTTAFVKAKNVRRMFSDCSSLTSIDTSSLADILDASSMFDNCIELKNISWSESFRPEKREGMFSNTGATSKTIITTLGTKEWIEANATIMNLENYTVTEETPLAV